ncbi:MAG TPA: phenylacetate-CoA oxygenase subunit PaaJ [Chitinophagaceae bacterium]|nr:phenylacetate-CoA oxygenase subunit PaaJ [Chitinophagaceae bacterium]
MVTNTISEAYVWELLAQVNDPEVPVLSVLDLGIVRAVTVSLTANENAPQVTVTITPTYTGCPATDLIAMNIRLGLLQAGIPKVNIQTVLSPAWTTDWITPEGAAKLKAYGIAPPVGKSLDNAYLEDITVPCPRCGSNDTQLLSAFGSTACKALYQCSDCKEPFDYFKCH